MTESATSYKNDAERSGGEPRCALYQGASRRSIAKCQHLRVLLWLLALANDIDWILRIQEVDKRDIYHELYLHCPANGPKYNAATTKAPRSQQVRRNLCIALIRRNSVKKSRDTGVLERKSNVPAVCYVGIR